MHHSFLKKLLLALVATLAATFSPQLLAQVVSSGMTGYVRGADNQPVSGVTVTAVHQPTNATFTAVTNQAGRFSFRGLPVGGPYTVSAQVAGQGEVTATDVTTELANDVDVKLAVKSDVVQLEKFVATGSRNELDSSSSGASTLLTAERLAAKPTTQRSLADLVSATPGVALRALSGDREEAMITAVGQNNRYNSVMIDGNRINDQFGLNSTGLASFFNPLSLDTIDQLSVQISPYDTRYSGFTGATINAVTKSGTNEFHGTAYYIFSGDHFAGLQLQGPDAQRLATSGVKVVPKLERETKGFTLGGPIWKDHIFFFLNWEKFDRIGAPNQAGLPDVKASDLALIDARVAQITKVNFGKIGGNASSAAKDEKKLAKIDWNINKSHRLSARYSTTEGEVPQFGNFTSTNLGSGNGVGSPALVGGATTAYDSHFYQQTRKEKSLSAQLFSSWTSDLKSELKWSHVKQDQYTPTNSIAPEIDIYGVSGVNQAGQSVTNGVVVLGTERFRHGNQINVDTKNYSASADYSRGNVTYSAGFDMEDNSYYNLFRSLSYGVFNYASPTDFLNDKVAAFRRDYTDLQLKGSYADVSQYTQTGVFANAKWDVSNRLKLHGGIRYDWSSSDTKPAFNQQFLTDTGKRNDGTVDGAKDISPRVGFNLALDEARKTQVRGGLGYFVGRSPWVFFSNSYGNSGVGTFSSFVTPTGGLTGYLANDFDPTKPNGTATQSGLVSADVAYNDAGIHMPSLWRGNISVDRKLGFLDSTVSLDLVYSQNEHTLFISNENIKQRGVAADGRAYFFGSLSGSAGVPNRKYANFINIFHTRNVRGGDATYGTLSWDRPMKNNWAFNVAYTRGRATEVQANGQTTAGGAWGRNAIFNQGAIEVGRADFEVKDRIQASVSRRFNFVKDFPTTASIYYEGRSGNPYSFLYSNDMNGDSFSPNDLVAIPTSLTDARFDFSALSTADQTTMMTFFETSGLSKYAGAYAPKNAFFQPWINRLDLSVRQAIPLHFHKAKLDLILDFTNFGSFVSKELFNYTERLTGSNDTFERRTVGNATIDTTTGKIKVTSFSPSAFLIDNTMSRWRVQVTARLSF